MKLSITVVPLGPGHPDLLTLQSAEALKSARRLILRTERHLVASWLKEQNHPYESLDSFYDSYEDFDRMHRAMAEYLWGEAVKSPLVFGVMDPGQDGAVHALKRSVPLDGVLQILSGLSLRDACEASLPAGADAPGSDFPDSFRVFSAVDFLSAPADPALSLWILELDSPLLAGDVKLRLADVYEDDLEVFFFPPSDQLRRSCRRIPLYRLDAMPAYDQTAALFIPGSSFLCRGRYAFGDLDRIVTRLRAPDGCPWDRVQTHASLTPYMVEEAWEAVGAIEDGDMDHLADELGDVLFQVFIHASIARSFDEFTMTDVLSHICHKMIERHPHVFLRSDGETADQIAADWEKIKRRETGSRTVGDTLNDVSPSLPSLKYAIKLHKKLAQLPALRRDPALVAEDIRSCADRLLNPDGSLSEEKMASLLLACTELCRLSDRDAEILLHRAADRLKKRYQAAENKIFHDQKVPESLTKQELCVYLSSAGIEED